MAGSGPRGVPLSAPAARVSLRDSGEARTRARRGGPRRRLPLLYLVQHVALARPQRGASAETMTTPLRRARSPAGRLRGVGLDVGRRREGGRAGRGPAQATPPGGAQAQRAHRRQGASTWRRERRRRGFATTVAAAVAAQLPQRRPARAAAPGLFAAARVSPPGPGRAHRYRRGGGSRAGSVARRQRSAAPPAPGSFPGPPPRPGPAPVDAGAPRRRPGGGGRGGCCGPGGGSCPLPGRGQIVSEKPGPGPGLEPPPTALVAVGGGGGPGAVVLPAGMINPSVPIRNIRMKFAVLIGLIQVGEVSNRDIVETVLNLLGGHLML
ncbi:translation initiation factor IF-2-like [Choloepus didactylus]|uniref:translation initiation factor IF-2-like n=1 Tax=Choloepus didactylus TaxID=27675 RepID=UPI00189D330F|nr:translation initiation factor IF-2-like [Choloepus didactylus]